MTAELFFTLLLISSVLTGLITEAIKVAMDSPNLVAIITSIITALCVYWGYVMVTATPVSIVIIAGGFALALMTFLCATLGYDKVMQTIKQLRG